MPALLRQLAALGGCTHPIRLDGHRTEHHLEPDHWRDRPRPAPADSADLPAGHLLVRCNNRRATRCPACAETYRRDTYHLITAGLRGGKGTPEQFATHPRVFATFTAPCFGPVHNRPTGPARSVRRCRCGAPTTRTTAPSARRSTRPPTTTKPLSCGTPTPGCCGAASPSTCAGRSPSGPGSPQRALREHARRLLRQGRRVPEARRRPLPRRHPPRRPRRWRHPTPGLGHGRPADRRHPRRRAQRHGRSGRSIDGRAHTFAFG